MRMAFSVINILCHIIQYKAVANTPLPLLGSVFLKNWLSSMKKRIDALMKMGGLAVYLVGGQDTRSLPNCCNVALPLLQLLHTKHVHFSFCLSYSFPWFFIFFFWTNFLYNPPDIWFCCFFEKMLFVCLFAFCIVAYSHFSIFSTVT